MDFEAITDWRNWHTAARQARTQAGQTVLVAHSATSDCLYLTVPAPMGAEVAHVIELQLTPIEAFALGAELMQTSMRAASNRTAVTT